MRQVTRPQSAGASPRAPTETRENAIVPSSDKGVYHSRKTFSLLINIVHQLGRFAFVCKALKTKKNVYQLQSFKVMHDIFFLIVDPTNLNNRHIFTFPNPGFRRPKNNKEFYVVTKTCVTGTSDL